MKTSLIALTALSTLAAALLAGCSGDDTTPTDTRPKFDVAKSSLARDTNPILTPAELTTLEQGQAEFAVDVLKAITQNEIKKGGDKNVFVSPHSISTALGMTYAGAVGETAAEMKKVLHLDLPDGRVHAGFNHLDLALSSRGQNQEGSKREDGTERRPFRLKVANSFWGEKTVTFEAPFLDILATNYGSGVNLVDFERSPEPSRLAINGWVEDQTEKRIKDLLPPHSLDLAQAVLVNAVYFNASWAEEFKKEGTRDAPFTKLDGSTATVATMHGMSERPYKKGEGYEAITLPYFGNEMEMLAIVPEAGTFKTFESSLTGAKVLEIMAGLEKKQVLLAFPKLKLESAFQLSAPLKALGMNRAFAGGFSGMTKEVDLFISEVFHNTFLAVDEEGTEAAAATAVVMTKDSAANDPLVMKVDRPFITAIVDRETKTLLFMGRIIDPK